MPLDSKTHQPSVACRSHSRSGLCRDSASGLPAGHLCTEDAIGIGRVLGQIVGNAARRGTVAVIGAAVPDALEKGEGRRRSRRRVGAQGCAVLWAHIIGVEGAIRVREEETH